MAKMTRHEICEELDRLTLAPVSIKNLERIRKLKLARDIIDAECAAEYKRLHPRS